MDSEALFVHRLHFAFTVTYHYLFPQLTMGLAPLIFILKTRALRHGDEAAARAARFWARIFGVSFTLGVVTGIPLEFQFGTNWAGFSRAAGAVIGQPLAMEGVFSFFLESAFLGLFLFGERRLGPRAHWFSSLALFVGSWLSGFFIIVTDAWMQHPVGYQVAPDGRIELQSLANLLANRWAFWQYAHNMSGALVTGCFAMAAIGAFYILSGLHVNYGRIFVRLAVIVGFVASVAQIFPTGDEQGGLLGRHQPVTLAAMEGLFHDEAGAPIAILGQPDVGARRLDNPLRVPRMLSFLTYRHWMAEVKGLDSFPQEDWPDNIPLLYYAYHIMVGLGTFFIAIMGVSLLLLLRGGRLFRSRPVLWALMLSLPFPFIANTAGWITAEVGRQPWLIYGLMRTSQGASPLVSAGNGWFTLLGYMGLYTVLTVLALFLLRREVERGPGEPVAAAGGRS